MRRIASVVLGALGIAGAVTALSRFTPSAGRERARKRHEAQWADNVHHGEPTYPSGLDFVR